MTRKSSSSKKPKDASACPYPKKIVDPATGRLIINPKWKSWNAKKARAIAPSPPSLSSKVVDEFRLPTLDELLSKKQKK